MTEKNVPILQEHQCQNIRNVPTTCLKINSEIYFLLQVMVVNAYIPSTREVEIGGLRVQDQPPLHSEFKTNLPTY